LKLFFVSVSLKSSMIVVSLLALFAFDVHCESLELVDSNKQIIQSEVPPNSTSTVEGSFITGMSAIRSNDIDLALNTFAHLAKERPNFKLAQLIYADLLASRAGPLTRIAEPASVEPTQLHPLTEEAKVRVKYHQQPVAKDYYPKNIIKMSDDQKHVIVVDMSLSRLYLFENDQGQPKLIKDFYASIGKKGADKLVSGDNKTPIGVYFITTRLLDENLPSKYGSGALPLNYPNALDYQLKKTGNGIWLHGSPTETYSRAPLASEGCVSLTNEDFSELDRLVGITTTPVILGEKIEWLSLLQWQQQQEQALQIIASWEQDWESLDKQRYIRHYSEAFSSGKDNYQTWKQKKARINGSKSFIQVELNNLSLYSYPDNRDILVSQFVQDYTSSNFNATNTKKRLYWKKEQDDWKIIYEGKPSQGKM
jgi:murein L,D-transpeptidase YafK